MKTDKLNKDKEIRTFDGELQTEKESRTIYGKAIAFDSPSQNIGFIETISPNSITADTIKNSDIYALLDHDDSRGILARSRFGNGTLELELRGDGLYFAFDAPHTALGDEVLEMIKRGDIQHCSFAFTLAQNGDEWGKENGIITRRVNKIDKLFDISLVYEPAYLNTECCVRKRDFLANLAEKLDALTAQFDLM